MFPEEPQAFSRVSDHIQARIPPASQRVSPGRSKPKMKVFKTKHVDDILDGKVAGIPKDAIYLEIGVGESFIETYKKKHKL